MIHIILPLYMFELTLNLLYINHCYSFNNLEKKL